MMPIQFVRAGPASVAVVMHGKLRPRAIDAVIVWSVGGHRCVSASSLRHGHRSKRLPTLASWKTMRRAELVMVREALEGVVSPTLATTLLFEALEASGRPPPATIEEMRAFAHGPLDDAVRKRMRDDDASQI